MAPKKIKLGKKQKPKGYTDAGYHTADQKPKPKDSGNYGGNLYTSEPTSGSVGTWNANRYKRYANRRDKGPITDRDRRMMMRATQYSDGTPADSEVRAWLRRLGMDERQLDTTRGRQLTRGAAVQMSADNPYSNYNLSGGQFGPHMQQNLQELGGLLDKYGPGFEQGIQWGTGTNPKSGNLTQAEWLQQAYNINQSPAQIIEQLRQMGALPGGQQPTTAPGAAPPGQPKQVPGSPGIANMPPGLPKQMPPGATPGGGFGLGTPGAVPQAPTAPPVGGRVPATPGGGFGPGTPGGYPMPDLSTMPGKAPISFGGYGPGGFRPGFRRGGRPGSNWRGVGPRPLGPPGSFRQAAYGSL